MRQRGMKGFLADASVESSRWASRLSSKEVSGLLGGRHNTPIGAWLIPQGRAEADLSCK